MLTCFMKRPMYLNKRLSSYYTNEYIRKLTEKNNLDRNKPKINNPLEDNGEKPTFHFYHFLLFLSISTMTMYFYKRLK
jgi:hypothetical protein